MALVQPRKLIKVTKRLAYNRHTAVQQIVNACVRENQMLTYENISFRSNGFLIIYIYIQNSLPRYSVGMR